MPRTYHLRMTAREDGSVVVENQHGASVTVASSGPETLSPVELLLASLGGCAAMDFVALMAKQRRPVAPLTVEVTAERADDENLLTSARVTYVMPTDRATTPQVERARRLVAEETCTVSRTLARGCPIEHVAGEPA